MYRFISAILVLCIFHFTAGAAPTASLECTYDTLKLSISKTELDAPGRNYTITFKGESTADCQIDHGTSNVENGNVWIAANYSECGIQAFEDGDLIFYNQTVVVTYGNDPSGSMVQREESDEYTVRCQKSRNFTQSASVFNVTETMGRTVDTIGNATFEIDLVRYTESNFQTEATNAMKLGDTFYFSLNLQTPRTDIGVYPQQCYATKSDGSSKYFLIKDRCKNNDDGTVKILSSTSDTKVFRWENEAFRYFGNSDEIYIHCDVLVCVGNAGTGCQRCSTNKRKRRSLSDLSGSVEVAGNTKEVGVRTPVIVLVDGRTETPNNNNNGNNGESVFSGSKGTIIIVLMALFVFIVAVAVIKKFFFTPVATTFTSPVSLKGVEAGYVNNGMQ